MCKITSFLVTSLLLLTLSCKNTSPHKAHSELTVHLSTSNSEDVIAGEFFLRKNSGKSRNYRSYAIENIVLFTEIETGKYSLMLNSQKIEDNISISEHTHSLFINLDETALKEKIEKAKQTYVDAVIKQQEPGISTHDPALATIDDVSFEPFIGIFKDCFVAVFYGGKYHGSHPDVVREIQIEHLTFYWPDAYPILVRNEGIIYKLADAYQHDLLSNDDLETIYNVYPYGKK